LYRWRIWLLKFLKWLLIEMTSVERKKLKIKLIVIKLLFGAVLLIFVGRLTWLQLIKQDDFVDAANNQQNLIIDIQAKRGTVYDRNNKVLAQDIDSYSYYVVPEDIKNQGDAAKKLARITGNSGWLAKFKKHPRFLWVSRKTSKDIEAQFDKLDIKTLNHVVEPMRVYPSGSLALSLLGRVDIDNNGLSGLELQYNDCLLGKNGKAILKRDGLGHCYIFDESPLVSSQTGSDIVTTIDLNLQQIVEQELAAGLIENNAAFGIGLFIKVGSGEILACAVLDSLGEPSRRNRAIADQYEPGSTFKTITTALGLSSGKFELNNEIFVENGKFRIGSHTISDDHEYHTLNVGDILVHSSNIGISKMALHLGDERMFKAIKEAGFVMPLGVDFPGEAGGEMLPLDWREHYLANISFGHGISASPLQLVSLYGAIASGGILYRPYFAKELIQPDGIHKTLSRTHQIRKVFSPGIASILNELLRQVVVRGTATKAASELVNIAGKTGTALKLNDNGRYDHRKSRASFVGYFPAENPMVVGIILYDEPKTSRYGGETSAPVFKRIAERYYYLPQQLLECYALESGELSRPENFLKEYPEQEVTGLVKTASVVREEFSDENLIPDFKGLTIRQALTLAAKKGIECEINGSGVVEDQIPVAGELIQPGLIIQLRCNSG